MPPHLHMALTWITDFQRSQQRFAQIDGFLYDLEGYTLMELAAHGEGVGAIVEIGSFMGRSTAFLAAGSKKSGREKVFAIDHFKGSPEHQPGQHFSHPVLQNEGTTFKAFQANLARVGVADQVVAIQSSSVEAANAWHEPIRLLFIDGEHSYDSVRQDYLSWSPFVVNHGYLCFHDVGACPDVTRFCEELVAHTGIMHEVCTVQSLKVLQKRT